ncbi:MAG: o-succinylbenzoate synthase [Actinomycetota bacterium]
MIEIRNATLIRADLPLVRPFRTSFGVQHSRNAVLLRLEVRVDGADSAGWGECVAGEEPFYSDEWGAGAWTLLRDVLIPMVAAHKPADLESASRVMRAVKGNPMAKATVEMALLDATLRSRGESLKHWLGGTKDRVECGVSIGMASSTDSLLDQIAGYLEQGYRRIKLKIEPGNDVAIVAPARERFPDVMMTVDANAAYSTNDIGALKVLDAYDLTLIEQPFEQDDLAAHTMLSAQITTPICLDESITSTRRAIMAIEQRATAIVNIKQGRMGGIREAFDTQAACATRGIAVWCGGMLETGIGRAANLALASLSSFTLPGDTSASKRYFEEDITPPFEMDRNGTMAVPDAPGLGVEPLAHVLARVTGKKEHIPL